MRQDHDGSADLPDDAPRRAVEPARREWPSPARVGWYLWRNRIILVAAAACVAGASALAFRVKEKTYRSISIVSSLQLQAPNPVKEAGGADVASLDVPSFFFSQLRASLFSADLIEKAAKETGLLGRESGPGLRERISRIVWSLGGGDMGEDEDDLARAAVDKIRFEKLTFEQIDRTRTDQAVGGVFRISMRDKSPQAARDFLSRVIALHRERLRQSEDDANQKLAKFYDEQVEFFASQAAGSDARIDFASNRERLQKIARLRAELDAKLAQETQLRTTDELKLGQLREALANAEARYSPEHPEVKTARAAFAEASKGTGGAVAGARAQIARLNKEIDEEFRALIADSGATVEGAGVSGEGHTQYFTKAQSERRSLSKVYERMQERYFQALVQARMAGLTSEEHFRVVEEPSLPLRPDAPRLIPWILLTVIAAAGAGVVSALVAEFVRRRARDSWLVERRAGVGIWSEQKVDSHFLLDTDAFLPEADAERTFRSRMRSFLPPIGARRARARKDVARETCESLAELFAHLGASRGAGSSQGAGAGSGGGALHCGLTQVTRKVSSAPVAFNLAMLTSRRARLKTLVVSVDHGLSLSRLLRASNVLVEAAPGAGFARVSECDFDVCDASAFESVGALLEAIRGAGYECVLWDLPPAEETPWHLSRLPDMALVGVAECHSNTYAEVAEGARWLRLLSSRRGIGAGLYLARSANPRFLRLDDAHTLYKAA